jgi:hypothetical protein
MIFLAFAPVCVWLGGAHPLVLFCWSVLVSFGGGYLIGWFHWRAAEREYAAFMNRDHDQEPVH